MSFRFFSNIAAFDVDNCIRPSPGPNRPTLRTNTLALALGKYLQKIQNQFCEVHFVSGAGASGIQITEEQLKFRATSLGASYGGNRFFRQNSPTAGGQVRCVELVNQNEWEEMQLALSALDKIAQKFDGTVTDRDGVCFSFHITDPSEFDNASAKMSQLIYDKYKSLELRPTRRDLGLVAACPSSNKAAYIEELCRQRSQSSFTICVAAGDSASDSALFQSNPDSEQEYQALYGIVTGDGSGRLNDELIEIAKNCPLGYYLAKKGEPDGIGLLAGLHKAEKAGAFQQEIPATIAH